MGEGWFGIPYSLIIGVLILVVGAILTHLANRIGELQYEIAELQTELNNLKWDVFNSAQGFYHHMSEPHPDKQKHI